MPIGEVIEAVQARIEEILAMEYGEGVVLPSGEVSYTEPVVPSIAVAVARDGEVIWEEGFGLANREQNIPATEHTTYNVGSISKPILATGLMVLVERGQIDLDSPINNYLGEAKLEARVGDAAEATVRRVADHTAGLPVHWRAFCEEEAYQPPPRDETIRRHGFLVTAPGERYLRSNLGYSILDYVISRVSGMSYADFMREEVFGPLGMTHTSVVVGPRVEEHEAIPYGADGSAIPWWDHDTSGAAEVNSSAHDLIRFAMFHLKNDLPDQRAIIDHAAIDELHQPTAESPPLWEWWDEGGCNVRSSYGIGWESSVNEDDLWLVRHSGVSQSMTASLVLAPEENLAVVVLSNTVSRWPSEIVSDILRALLPGKVPDDPDAAFVEADEEPARFEPPRELIGSWEGLVYTYEGDIRLVLEINKSGSVYAMLGEQARTILTDVSYQDVDRIFWSAGGGPFLRGWMRGDIGTQGASRLQPCQIGLEVKLRDDVLNGSLIADCARGNLGVCTVAHWVEMRKK